MKLELQAFEKLLSCCLCCGSLWTDAGFLCGNCTKLLERYRADSPKDLRNISVHTVFDWTPGQSDSLSRLILHLKKANSQSAWKHYALQIVSQKVFKDALLSRRAPIFVVPAPARKHGRKDHAYRWGQALADALGADFVPCLKRYRSDSEEQKKQSLQERAELLLDIDENYTAWPQNLKEGTWLFADDIVTTGSTARAAHLALGSPAHFRVAALAYRRLSCGGSKNLL